MNDLAHHISRRRARVAEALARRRVPLGFVAAAAVVMLAKPTGTSWISGVVVASIGEAIRVWAAGHLEKSREVTRSGPYRFTRHPLYVGSSVLALGVVIASYSLVVAAIAAVYMGATVAAAIYTEEAFLRQAFGTAYDEYSAARAEPMDRRFSFARVMQNREYRAVTGLIVGFALLALKIWHPI
jgi:protein-S-isoprenylcysteine O-methyltransferase Ste14